MESDPAAIWGPRIVLAVVFFFVSLTWYFVGKSAARERQNKASLDATSMMLMDSSLDTTGSHEDTSVGVSHHCDAGSHIGGFDSGCSSHH